MAGKKVAIFGGGGHGKVILDILLESGAEVAGFLDDDPKKAGAVVCGYKVLGGFAYLEGKTGSLSLALGIGDNKIRRKIFDRAVAAGVEVVSAVHPSAAVSRLATVARGAAIMAGAVVNPDATIGEGAVVNTGATVDHDCRLERFCQVWPGAHLAGTVRVGEAAYIGTGASVIPGITIGKDARIGAGAAVLSDVAEGTTVVGVPARPVKRPE